ncbi:hypothetical protein [Epilithonimonas sp. UC225_85]|uniref:hypothetical protein n=1 Tax=Epilithonimonas sp. UC225_85 TaxID=3350167 RepID=UPI0036D2CD2E
MKKFIAILTITVVSLSFTSCRQEDDSADLTTNNSAQQGTTFKKSSDSVETDTIKASATARPVDPDPPVKDGTSW